MCEQTLPPLVENISKFSLRLLPPLPLLLLLPLLPLLPSPCRIVLHHPRNHSTGMEIETYSWHKPITPNLVQQAHIHQP